LLAKITVHETDAPPVPRVVDSCIDNIGVDADQSASTVRTAELIAGTKYATIGGAPSVLIALA
jgi:hypothetical protein